MHRNHAKLLVHGKTTWPPRRWRRRSVPSSSEISLGVRLVGLLVAHLLHENSASSRPSLRSSGVPPVFFVAFLLGPRVRASRPVLSSALFRLHAAYILSSSFLLPSPLVLFFVCNRDVLVRNLIDRLRSGCKAAAVNKHIGCHAGRFARPCPCSSHPLPMLRFNACSMPVCLPGKYASAS